jgi:site-specific recombinase XerD
MAQLVWGLPTKLLGHIKNVPDVAVRSLRHWYGTNLVATGADLSTAQTLLRHANLNTTAIYVQVSDPKHVEAIDRLDPLGWRCLSTSGAAAACR